jgi:hypothetical protein
MDFLEARRFRFEHAQACSIVQFDKKTPAIAFDALSLINAAATN